MKFDDKGMWAFGQDVPLNEGMRSLYPLHFTFLFDDFHGIYFLVVFFSNQGYFRVVAVTENTQQLKILKRILFLIHYYFIMLNI